MKRERLPVRKADLVLEAAKTFGETAFTVSGLVVRAWQMFPSAFGLHDYKEVYPDSKAVESLLYGRNRGLISEGKIIQVEPGVYQVVQPRPVEPPPPDPYAGKGGWTCRHGLRLDECSRCIGEQRAGLTVKLTPPWQLAAAT